MATVFPKLGDFDKVGKAFKGFGKDANSTAGVLDKVGNAFRKLTGNADQAKNGLNQGRDALGRFTAAGSGLAGMGPYGQAIAVGMTVATIAITATVGALLSLAAAAISVTQENSKMLTTFSALAGSASGGKEILAVVNQLSEKLPLPREQIGELAKNLASAGFRGQALGKAVEAVAAATAIMGEQGGHAAQKMMQTLAEGGAGADKMLKTIAKGGPKANSLLQQMGLSADDLGTAQQRAKMTADQMGVAIEKALAKKGAGPLAEMGQTFPVMLAKLKEGFFSLFEGLGPAVKPFMAAVQSLFGQFTRGKGPMKALGGVATQALGAIFKWATLAVKAISAFVAKNFTAKNVGKTWDNIKSAIEKVGNVLGFVWQQLGPIFTSESFLNGLAAIFKVIAVVVGACVAGFALLTVVLGGLAGSVIDLVGIGASLISGLVDAVTSGAGAFVDAMRSLASQGLDAFKNVLGIHSPSAVMMQMGDYTAQGAAMGIDAGAGDVEKSAVRLGAGVAGGAAKGMGGGGSKSGRGAGVTITGGLHLHAGADTTSEQADELVALFLERLAATQGV